MRRHSGALRRLGPDKGSGWRERLSAIAAGLTSQVLAHDFGRPATPDEIKLWNIDVRPDGKGLPDRSSTVAQGKQVFADNCAACHGDNGRGSIKDRLVSGQRALASDKPIKTVGSFLKIAAPGEILPL